MPVQNQQKIEELLLSASSFVDATSGSNKFILLTLKKVKS